MHDTGRGVIIARFGRTIDGVQVLGEQLSVAMDRSFELVALTGFVTGDMPRHVKTGARARSAFRVDAASAMVAAMADLSGTQLSTSDFDAPRPAAGNYQKMALHSQGARRARAGADASPARGKPVFVRKDGALEPAYFIEANLGSDAEGQPRASSYVVSATDGSVVQKHSLAHHQANPSNPYRYQVWADPTGLNVPFDGPTGNSFTPHPTSSPDGTEPELVPSSTITLSSLTQVGVNDPWLPAGASETRGNNADVFLDLSAPQGFTPGTADRRGQVSGPNAFDFAFDFGRDSDATDVNRNASTASLFYLMNWLHDWYYVAGFDEASGNAQQSNYGRGGLEGDPLLVEAQSFLSVNNALSLVFSEGQSPVLTFFSWLRVLNGKITVSPAAGPALEFTELNAAPFGPRTFDVSGQLVLANPANGCTPLIGDYTDKIVFINRGGCPLADKVPTAEAAGAAAVIIGNIAGVFRAERPPTIFGPSDLPVGIPALSLSQPDADRVRAALAASPSIPTRFQGTVRFLDGALDNQIVAHEWGHYISNRLILDGFGLLTGFGQGLGEGYADFHAMLLTVREEDTKNPLNAMWNGTYATANYALGNRPNSYYYGARRYPYSTDFTKNPLTFKHISDAVELPATPAPFFFDLNSEVHNTGEVWTQMLWECYTALLRDTIGPAPRLTFNEARERMRDYVVASYKLVPQSPTLLEARDALLAVVSVADKTDFLKFGAAFAKRGAGVYAVAPPRSTPSNSPVIESYAFGPAVRQVGAVIVDDVTPQCGANGILDNGEVATLRVTFRNVGASDTPPLFARVTSQTTGVKFPTDKLEIPAIPRGGSADATIRVTAAGLAPLTPINITVTTFDFGLGETDPPVRYSFAGNAQEVPGISNVDTAERDLVVWQITNSDPRMTEVWGKAQISSSNRTYHAESSIFGGNSTELTSPPLAVAPGQPLTLAFKHRHAFDEFLAPGGDGGVIQISTDDGATWTNLFDLGIDVPYTNFIFGFLNPLEGQAAFTGQSAAFPELEPVSINLGTQFGGQTVRLRFVVGSDVDIASQGWDIDDITIGGLVTPPFPGLAAKACNVAPTANAGADRTVRFGTVVQLQGEGSDPEGSPVTFQWTAPPGITLDNPRSATPRFFAPIVANPVNLTFSLVVTDAQGQASAPDAVVITVRTNRTPID